MLAGIKAAQAAGLAPVKVNTVLMRGVNDDEAPALLRRALDEGWRLRFIEQMPLDPSGHLAALDDGHRRRDLRDALRALHAHAGARAAARRRPRSSTSTAVPATVGIIASVTRPFCAACDRLRLTADGQLRNCLFARDELDLRTALRDEALDDEAVRAEVERRLRLVVKDKLPGHGINDPNFIQPTRPDVRHRRLTPATRPPRGAAAGQPRECLLRRILAVGGSRLPVREGTPRGVTVRVALRDARHSVPPPGASMDLQNSFVVPSDIETAWKTLQDVEGLAPVHARRHPHLARRRRLHRQRQGQARPGRA